MRNSRFLMQAACLVTFVCLAGVALAETQAEVGGVTENEEVIQGEAMVESVEITATITKIDKKTREVTIQTEDGQEISFIAGDEVRNFAQMNKGDIITATYVEALAYEVISGDLGTGADVEVGAAAADIGEMPAVAVAGKVTVAVTIIAIDTEIPTVTFEGPEGNTRTIKVMHPEKLEGVKVGDTVILTYTEALAIKVEKASK